MKKLIVLLVLLFAAPVFAGDVTVTWDSPGPDLPSIFVRVFYGESSCIADGAACFSVDAPPGVNEVTIEGLPKKTILYFAAKAINPDLTPPLNESGFSNQVVFTDLRNITITIDVKPIK